MGILRRLERTIKVKFSHVKIPTGEEVCAQRLLEQVESIKNIEIDEQVAALLPQLTEQLGEEMTQEELLGKVITYSFARFLKNYRKAKDLNQREPRERRSRNNGSYGDNRRGERTGRRARRQRLFINIGSMDVGGKGPFINMICREAKIPGQSIGRIDMQEKFTFFEVEENAAEQVIKELKDAEFEGRTIRVNAGDRFERKNKRSSRSYRN